MLRVCKIYVERMRSRWVFQTEVKREEKKHLHGENHTQPGDPSSPNPKLPPLLCHCFPDSGMFGGM